MAAHLPRVQYTNISTRTFFPEPYLILILLHIHSRHPKALFDLEATNAELKADLRDLYINGAREVDISKTRKAVVITVSSTDYLLIVYRALFPFCFVL